MAAMIIDPTQGQQRVRHAFALANRGMLYAAEKEFLAAISAVAEAKDVASVTGRFTRLVDEGLTCLREAEDFQPPSAEASRKIDVEAIARFHRCDAVRRRRAETGEPLTSPLAAVAAYYREAQNLLGQAMAGDPSGSMALYGLAKFHASLAELSVESRTLETRKAMTLFQAALLAHPHNHLAAHELGVHFARQRRYELAEQYLTRSMQVRPTSVACRNLSIVQRQRGDHVRAAKTGRYAEQLAGLNAQQQLSGQLRGGPVQWMSPQAFAASAGPNMSPGSEPIREEIARAPSGNSVHQ